MDLSLIIFLIIVIYFIFKGYRAGILAITSRILSLLAAYIVAFLFARSFGQWIQSNTALEGLMTYAVAGFILFFSTSILLGFAFTKVINATDGGKVKGSFGRVSSISGALIGGLVGVLLGLFFVWFYSFLHSTYQEKRNLPISAPTQIQQTAKDLAGSVVKKIVYGATKQKDLANVSAAFLSSPAENIKRVKALNDSQVMRLFFDNYTSQQALNTGNAKVVMNDPAFQKLIAQKDFVALTKEFMPSIGEVDMQKQMAIKITELWTKIDQVKADPEYLQLINSPDIQKIVESSDIYALMSNAKVERMLDIISSAKESIKLPKQPTEKTNIHRWVDDKGQVHYSDQENDNQ